MPTDRHDDAARVGCPECKRTPFVADGQDEFPCPECKRVAALLRETERTAVRRCYGLAAVSDYKHAPWDRIRAEYPEHFGGDDGD